MGFILRTLEEQLEELLTYPPHVLFSIVENASARTEFRVRAAKLLRERGTKWAFHPDVTAFLALNIPIDTQLHPFGEQLVGEKPDILPEIESENPALTAGFTTKSWGGTHQNHFPNEFETQNDPSV